MNDVPDFEGEPTFGNAHIENLGRNLLGGSLEWRQETESPSYDEPDTTDEQRRVISLSAAQQLPLIETAEQLVNSAEIINNYLKNGDLPSPTALDPTPEA